MAPQADSNEYVSSEGTQNKGGATSIKRRADTVSAAFRMVVHFAIPTITAYAHVQILLFGESIGCVLYRSYFAGR